MSLLDRITEAPRRIMTLFYLVDVSASMAGEKLGAVNAAIEEAVISDLPELSAANDDAEISIAILRFSSGCEWVTPESGPISAGDLVWQDLTPGGITDLGAAFFALDAKLSRKEFLRSQTGAYAPVILLFSDGVPTDNWRKGLEKLEQNNWFRHAVRIAVAIGEDADRRVLSAFTGSPASVVAVHDQKTLQNLVRKVSLRASEFQSRSRQAAAALTTPAEDAAAIVRETALELSDVPPATAPDGSVRLDGGPSVW